jgi:hypothetical protein
VDGRSRTLRIRRHSDRLAEGARRFTYVHAKRAYMGGCADLAAECYLILTVTGDDQPETFKVLAFSRRARN